MIPVLVTLLILNGVFNAVVWPAFYRRVARDERSRDERGHATRFLVVHTVLIAVAVILAAVSILAGIIAATGAWT
ncbi:SCO4848 family membrane protein [Microbacterium oleivorans]|uniref:Integral membrane protein n=1 Tax=Microbacterium oleivorans TaxID=273677 RepID=A0A4R5YJY0_9MICO|nr:hypothetical protein [Microbacterium oleivorans]TDL43717.1 hypothetical protein E2R54_10990 [Microbacterium oleivorans]